MKKLFLSVVCAVGILMAGNAQEADKAALECVYRLSFLKDTTSNAPTRDIMVLRLNKQKSIFYSLNSYTLDSLLTSDRSGGVQMDILAGGLSKYGKRVVSYNILKEFPAQQLTHTDNVGGEHYRYTEPLPPFNWELKEETKQVGDYICQKAVCTFRGRTYEAWFTGEVPVSDGPWKFCGLPGLILEVRDTQGHYSFTYAGMRKGGSIIALLPRDYTTTSREKYLKAYKNYIKDPLGFLAATSIKVVKVGSSGRGAAKVGKGNYEPMERDF